ncbi:O-antigen ligase family protein [Plastoroseomonas arctica]|uniref:O-antigen ligase family protein n=1 Tax=Plastoroseomonas arctica TaxID=1509237 RepID=A0AAF1K5K3_9PROT|nr:O-antigen ligase family protein [Plastoroseomonas arctica]MBR0656379.1 O-antigen ligase family protein [Plastoroseomonas arctica]
MRAAMFAAPAGVLAAGVHFAGALKSAPLLADLPFDLTLALAALLAPPLAILALSRRWRIDAGVALPLLSAAALWFWMVVSASWGASRDAAAGKLAELVLMAPVMLAAGLLVGADARMLRRFALAVVAIAVFVGASVAIGIADRSVVLGGLVGADPERARVQYQVTGLALASGAALAAVFALERRGVSRLAWVVVALALVFAALLPGGRAGLIALVLAVTVAPMLLLWRSGAWLAGMFWPLLVAASGGLAALVLLLAPDLVDGLRTLERLTENRLGDEQGRLPLWNAALRWGAEAPLGLGAGSFGIATGSGDTRRLHPHDHALESLAEGGWPALLLWLGAFGGAGLAALGAGARATPGRVARIAALTLPMALTVMVSTDLGNRMAWLALGLALSLRIEARNA